MDKKRLKSLLIKPDVTIKKAMQKLEETAEKILFVVNHKKRLVGTLTDGDIRRGIISGMYFDAAVQQIMNQDFLALTGGIKGLEEVAKQLMVENKIEQVPILDENGVITDIILWMDMLKTHRGIHRLKAQPNQVVVMAGGMGTRLDPFTKILPKPLIPIGNKPVIEVIMEKFYKSGFSRFIYTLNYKKEYLKLFLKENNFPYSIEWVEEDNFLGTAGGLLLLQDRINDTFFVTNCDSILEVDFAEVLKWHKESEAAITIIGCHNEVKIPFGVLELSGGTLRRIREKPVHDVIINTGVYVMEPQVISLIPKGRKVDMNWLIDAVAKTEKVSVYPMHGGWFDIGQWGEYRRTVEALGSDVEE